MSGHTSSWQSAVSENKSTNIIKNSEQNAIHYRPYLTVKKHKTSIKGQKRRDFQYILS